MKIIKGNGEQLHQNLETDINEAFGKAAREGFPSMQDEFDALAERCDEAEPKGRLKLAVDNSALDDDK
ncbi:MAG: hypothetical protein KZQ58_01110 [gamma proteobacterium symbiont of Bathyaustriella thionipta]|nr:hypothetical protein [gamma proteobacterium symbiont of Bathyaustriella thionipta]